MSDLIYWEWKQAGNDEIIFYQLRPEHFSPNTKRPPGFKRYLIAAIRKDNRIFFNFDESCPSMPVEALDELKAILDQMRRPLV